jgi:hypothetical protein
MGEEECRLIGYNVVGVVYWRGGRGNFWGRKMKKWREKCCVEVVRRRRGLIEKGVEVLKEVEFVR